tara:strand:- start:12189 stop:12353 length:165 start_codon:yes stop_codon:yes gene_type:complete
VQPACSQGSRFAYAFGLTYATAHLEDLGLELPELTPYDDIPYKPMPEVDIAPED